MKIGTCFMHGHIIKTKNKFENEQFKDVIQHKRQTIGDSKEYDRRTSPRIICLNNKIMEKGAFHSGEK